MHAGNPENLTAKGLKNAGVVAGLCLALLAGPGAQAAPAQHPGARTFLTFCAGCHGMDGFAAYEHAPSFSMGERLQKDDRELLQSVLKGTGNMPPWRGTRPAPTRA